MKHLLSILLGLYSLTTLAQKPLSVEITRPISVSGGSINIANQPTVTVGNPTTSVNATLVGTPNVNLPNAITVASGNVTATIPDQVNINGTPVSLVQLAKEGRSVQVSNTSLATVVGSPITTTVNYGQTLAGAAALQFPPGRAYYCTSFVFSAGSGPIECSGAFSPYKAFGAFLTNQLSPFTLVSPSVGGSVVLSPNQLIESEGSVTASTKWLGANNAPFPYCYCSFSGIEFTADFDFSAKHRILIVGESTAWSTMGNDPAAVAYPKDSLWTFRLVNTLRAQNKSVRHINKAFGGATSQNIAYAQRAGYLDVQYDLLVYNAQHNDKTVSTTQAIYQANLKSIIDHRNMHNPQASILFLSDFPQDAIASADARNANYRSWMQQVATGSSFGGGTANRVYYQDCSDAFALNATPSADLNMTERTAGTRLHPSGLGHGILFRTKIWPAVQLTDFYLNTKW